MIKVFIGTEPKTEIPYKVLCYSIHKYCILPITITPLEGFPWTTRPNPYIGTGFSLLRWDIPRLCNYDGYAIYLDVDIICLDDIRELWQIPNKYPNYLTSTWCTYQRSKWYNDDTPESSVMLINCNQAKDNQPSLEHAIKYIEIDPNPKDRRNYIKIMRCLKHRVPPQKIPNRYNTLNNLTNDTLLLHYTKEPEQPWYNPEHSNRLLWEKYLIECIDENVITRQEIETQIQLYKPHTKTERGEGLHPYYKRYL